MKIRRLFKFAPKEVVFCASHNRLVSVNSGSWKGLIFPLKSEMLALQWTEYLFKSIG